MENKINGNFNGNYALNPYILLLKKYINHVVKCEGVDFIDSLGNDFNKDEKLVLNNILCELNKENGWRCDKKPCHCFK